MFHVKHRSLIYIEVVSSKHQHNLFPKHIFFTHVPRETLIHYTKNLIVLLINTILLPI